MSRVPIVLGVVLPTLASALFEGALWVWGQPQPMLLEVVGRVALMLTASSAFSLVVWQLLERQRRSEQHQHRKFQDLFGTASEAILIVDQERRILALNPKAQGMLGYSEPLGSMSLCRLCVPPPGAACPGQCPLTPDQPRSLFPCTVRHRDGHCLSVAASVSCLPAETNGRRESLLRLADIDSLRTAEEARLARRLAGRALEAQEEERRRLGRELHDGLGQGLFALRLAAQLGQPVVSLTIQLMEEVDRLAKNLWPPVLDKLGVGEALRSAFAPLPQVKLDIESGRFPAPLEAALFRISQEAVSNALKHGQAEEVLVQLRHDRHRITLRIEDEGSGFEPGTRPAGLGLTGIRQRVEHLGGLFKLRSEPGQGTSMKVELPLT